MDRTPWADDGRRHKLFAQGGGQQDHTSQNVRSFIQVNQGNYRNDDVPHHFEGQSPRPPTKFSCPKILLQKNYVREAVERPNPLMKWIPPPLTRDGHGKNCYVEWINARRSMYSEQTKIRVLSSKRYRKAGDKEECDHSRLPKFKPTGINPVGSARNSSPEAHF